MSDEALAGQAVYSRLTLAVYDVLVLGLSNRFVWRCPTSRLLALYDASVSARHLDVGVGTGYFLDRCAFPDAADITLVDMNRNCLDVASRRIRRYAPACFQRNVLEPLELGTARFDSVGMGYLLHCLPGDLRSKAVVLDHVETYLAPGGTLFGATLLARGVPRTRLAVHLMEVYNARGIFSNLHDDLDVLRDELSRRFPAPEIETVGCAALFRARKPGSRG